MGDPQRIARLEGAIEELRCELMLTQAALAVVAEEVIVRSMHPEDLVAEMAMKILGLGDPASRRLRGGKGRPQVITNAAARMVDWIEGALAGIPRRRPPESEPPGGEKS